MQHEMEHPTSSANVCEGMWYLLFGMCRAYQARLEGCEEIGKSAGTMGQVLSNKLHLDLLEASGCCACLSVFFLDTLGCCKRVDGSLVQQLGLSSFASGLLNDVSCALCNASMPLFVCRHAYGSWCRPPCFWCYLSAFKIGRTSCSCRCACRSSAAACSALPSRSCSCHSLCIVYDCMLLTGSCRGCIASLPLFRCRRAHGRSCRLPCFWACLSAFKANRTSCSCRCACHAAEIACSVVLLNACCCNYDIQNMGRLRTASVCTHRPLHGK